MFQVIATILQFSPAEIESIDDETVVAQIRNGRVLPVAAFGDAALTGRPWAVLDREGSLLAVYERRGPEEAKPLVVLAR